MAEKKSWRDYSKSATANTEKGVKKTGTWRNYIQDDTSDQSSGGWRSYSKLNSSSIVGDNVVTRVNAWLNKHNSYLSEYQKRYEGRKYSYEDAYVGDSAEWLASVGKKKSEFDAEADSIISYIDQNKGYLNQDWIDQVKYAITSARGTQNQLIASAKKDNDYWAKFNPNEEQAAAGYTPEKLYTEWQADRKQHADDLVFDVEAGMVDLEKLKQEKDAYLADQEEKRKQARSEESWLDKIVRWSGNSPDTSLPIVGSGGYSSDTINTSQYDKLIAEKEAQIERAKYAQGYEGYMGNMDAEDYAANSKYVSTRTDVAMEDATWGLYNDRFDTSKLFGDYLYDYINRNPDALGAATVNDTASSAYLLGFDQGFLKTMTDEEIGVYNYLYKTQGSESANEYLSFIESDLEGRRRVQEQAFWAAYAKESPVASSVFSTLISPLKGFSYLGQAADMLDDGKMDENAGYNRFSYIPSSIRSQVSSTIEKSGKWGKVGSFAYNTGMSMADFLFTTAVSGGNQALSLAIMGSGAAADATLAAKDRGLDDGQAFALGTIAGLAEVAMEKISLGAWLEGDMTEGALRYVLKNALSEGGEEAGTSVANLLADIIIAGDKSEWKMAIQSYIDQGKSEEEAFALVLAENAAQIGLDALGGILSGAAIGGGTYAGSSIAAGFEYGKTGKDKTYTQKLVAEGIELNPDSKYVQKAKSKVDKGKNLTGMQVRNILAANNEQITANDMKKIQQAAEKRLTSLGQTEDVRKVAELATKYATGGKLTRAETSFLANSKYGSRVANELLPDNIASGDYSTEWAENIGTKQVNFGAYNIRAIVDEMLNKGQYTSLDSRMEGETPAKVSDTGKAVISGTNEEIDLAKPTFKQITDEGVVLLVNGKDVRSDNIDYESEDQALAINAIGKIEHITPEAAGALYDKVDMTKDVMPQLNGIDEAFTYGYYNYSEADLEAGTFTGNLTKDQLNDAYKLGQHVRKNDIDAKADAFKAMRTAADAIAEKNAEEGKAAPGAKNLTITYKNVKGEAVSLDEEKLSHRQSGGVEWAKILHKMGLGTKVEFFESYISDTIKVKDKKTGKMKAARVFINDAGVEQIAYSGVYRKKDGTIRIDLNAYNGRGFTLNALAHELTHFIQQWSDKKYKVLVDFLMKEYENTDMTMHERVLREQKRLEDIRGEKVSYGEAYDEVVANAMNKMFDDGKMAEKLAKLKEQDKNLAQKLWEGFKEILAKFIGIYEKEGLFQDADVLDEMKETFDQLQNMFAEALVEASENYQAYLITKEAGLEFVAVEDVSQNSYSSLAEAAGFEAVENEDGTRSFVREGKKVSKVTIADIDNSPIGAFINFSLEMGDISEADAKRQKQMFADICTMACKTNDFAMTMQFVGSAVFTGMKANADKQYGTTYDFPSICTKTQAVIDAMSAKMMSLGRGLNTEEIVQLYNDVFASGNPVPCPECYVFSRWIGIGGLLDNIKKYQDYYGDMDVKDVAAAYLKMKAEVSKFADEQGISFGKAKGALTSKLTKEFNKLTEKIEKNENQGENVKASDRQRLAELEPMMNTVKSMTWLENVYFADSSLKKVNPNFRVPDSVLFDLNNGEAFATKYKEAWAFRTTQGDGYGKAITPYAEARLGEGVLVTNNTTNAIKGKAQGSLNNYFLNQMGKLDKQSRDALKRARLKQKIQAFLGGQRFQSTSDARYENASDYLLAALEMQAMGGMVQCYTKVDGAVPAFSAWGFSINQSLMPLNGGLDANGNVKDTGVGGMKPSVAFENRNKYESAGTITIGVNDNHIRAMFKQWVRDFIIPYHASGGKADVVAAFRSIQEGKEAKGKAVRSTDYSRTQGDKVLSDDVLRWQGKTDAQIQRIHEIRNARIAILTGGKPNMTVVRSNRFLSALYDKFNGGEWDGVKIAKSKVESQIFPNEFWDQTVTYEESAKITKDYLEYCEDLGFLHRFSGMVPSNGKLVPVNGYNENGERVQLTDLAYKYDADGNKTTEVEEFFWKVLTDRRMYDNNGNYLAQKVVTLNDTTTDTVTGFAKNNQGREYDKAKAEALAKKIVGEQYSSQETDADNKKNRASNGSPLTRRSVKQRSVGSTHEKMSSTAAAEILGIENIANYSESVKNAITVLGEFYVSVDTRKPVLGFKRTITASNLEGSLIAQNVLTREGTSGSAYRYDDGHALRISNHSANANNFVGDGEHLSIALFEKGKMNDFVEGKSNVIEAVFRRRYLDGNPEALKQVIHDIAHFITDGEYHDTAGAMHYNFSGTEAFKKQAQQRMAVDGVAREQRAEQYSSQETDADNAPMYSEHETDYSNRSLLANAFEGITKDSIEYKMIQEYKGHIQVLNMLDKRLGVLNDQIHDIRFTKGKYDAEKLQKLESEREDVVKEINRYDKMLLNLEASEPLRKVIQRERQKEAQKTKEHVKEIQQNKKLRAEQTELRHKIRKAIRDLDKLLNRGNKKVNVKDDLQPVVTKALQAAEILFTDNYGNYDMLRNGIGADLSDAEEALVETCAKMLKDLDKMPTDGYENFQARQEAENRLKTKMSKLNEVFARERKRLNNTKVSSILGELADAYKSLETSDQSYVQGAYSEPVYNFLKNLQSEVGGTIVKDMSKDQLENVYAAYKMVLTTVRKANQMFNEELKQTREQLGNAVIQEVLNAGGVHLLGTKLGDAISQFDWNNMKPIWLENRVGSETFGKLVNGLFKGQYNFAVDIDGAKQFKLEMDKKYKPRNWDAEKQYKFQSSTGKEFGLNLQQIMSLYAFSKREQAYSHLLNGGFVFEDNSTVVVDGKLGIKKTYIHKGAASYKLNEATLNSIINSLTKEQKAYVDEMQKYLSDVMGAKGNEVSMQLYGIKMFNEQFYFPLRSSGAYMERAKEAELKKQQGQINLVNSGFTHSVKPEAKNPIILSGFMDVWAEHCNEMSMYHSMVLPMEDFRKVYNYSTIHDENMESASVYQTIQDAYGKAATNYIDQLYRELNAGATVDPREAPFKRMISNFKKAAVMLSGSVVVQQFSSIGRAYDIIDPKYFTGAKVNSGTNLSVADEMKKYAPVAIIKEMGGFDTGTKGSAKSYIMAEQYGKGERVKGLLKDEQYRGDIMGYLPAKADELTWSAIWEAVKRETKAKNPKMDVKSEEFLKLAGERFSEVIEKTQVYDSVLARSANMRSKGNFMAMATAFMAEPTTTINLLEDAIRSGKAKNIARAFGSVAVSIVLNNALASIVYAMRDDDDDETFLEKYFQAFTSGMIDDINPMSYYPFLKDVYSLFQGYDVERADMSVIADVRDALKRVVSLLGKDTSGMGDDELAEYYKQVNEVFMGLLDAGCSMFGVPLKNVRRDALAIVNGIKTIGTDFSDERDNSWLSFWDKVGAAAKDTIPIYAWTKDKSKNDKLYDAIISGDNEYLARLKSTYKTDSAYHSAVRKALRENDSRIKEAAQARYEGKTEEYKRIFREIQKEGKFGFDDIMSAINTELSKLEPDKVTSEYSAKGFVEAVAAGNASHAATIRDDIIATHIANGKTQAEAEKAFVSDVKSGINEAYSYGTISKDAAKEMLMEYADMDEEDAADKITYWDFCKTNPNCDLSESKVLDYLEFAEPAHVSLEVYEQFVAETKGLADIKDEWGDVEVTKREQVLEVIDSLPLTWQQKDALYLACDYAGSKIWDVPW